VLLYNPSFRPGKNEAAKIAIIFIESKLEFGKLKKSEFKKGSG